MMRTSPHLEDKDTYIMMFFFDISSAFNMVTLHKRTKKSATTRTATSYKYTIQKSSNDTSWTCGDQTDHWRDEAAYRREVAGLGTW